LIGKAAVVRLDILSQVGWQAATHYGVRGVPTLIVIDGQGQAVDWQYGLPRPGQIVAQVETLLATK
jgi:hypothetical protein